MKTENGSTLVVDVGIRGKQFERFRGDGLCISTLQVQLLIIRH